MAYNNSTFMPFPPPFPPAPQQQQQQQQQMQQQQQQQQQQQHIVPSHPSQIPLPPHLVGAVPQSFLPAFNWLLSRVGGAEQAIGSLTCQVAGIGSSVDSFRKELAVSSASSAAQHAAGAEGRTGTLRPCAASAERCALNC